MGTRTPYGVAANAFDNRFIPGGSSSGSAAAVGAGLLSFALGTDTAGSGRVPAGYNGCVGLKGTLGKISTVGEVAQAAGRSTDQDSTGLASILYVDALVDAEAVPQLAASLPTTCTCCISSTAVCCNIVISVMAVCVACRCCSCVCQP